MTFNEILIHSIGMLRIAYYNPFNWVIWSPIYSKQQGFWSLFKWMKSWKMVKCIERPADIGLCHGKRNTDIEGSTKIPENFQTSKTCQKSERKLHCGVRRRNKSNFSISPQISDRVESLRLNASASVSIWYAKVDPIKVVFSCYHIATCFSFKLCAWHVVSQHKGCNKIGNCRPNLCTWLEEGLWQNPSWFEVSVLGIDLRTSQYSHNRHKCWHTALNVNDAFRCVWNTSEMQTTDTLRSWGGSCLNRTPPRKLSMVAPDKHIKVQTVTNSYSKKHLFQRLDRWCQSQRQEHQSDSEGWNTSAKHQSTAAIETSETSETSKQFQNSWDNHKKRQPHSISLTFFKNRLCALVHYGCSM